MVLREILLVVAAVVVAGIKLEEEALYCLFDVTDVVSFLWLFANIETDADEATAVAAGVVVVDAVAVIVVVVKGRVTVEIVFVDV